MLNLKYLFAVLYKDGSQFLQTPEDVSAVDPKRSAFFDVRQSEVERFLLTGRDSKWCVDLRDGHFELNGVRFYAQIPPPGATLRLIYFRRHRHHFTTGMEEIGHEVEYHFGWQTTHEGKNYQQTIILR